MKPAASIHDTPCPAPDLEELNKKLLHLRTDILAGEKAFPHLEKINPRHRNSARNLLQYLALRRNDIRGLQYKLTSWGLSSLGRAERKVQASIDTVLYVVQHLLGKTWTPTEKPPFCFEEGRRQLEENSAALFGPKPQKRRARIMVTMPSEAAFNSSLVRDLLENGMNIARINCAHDGPETWLSIIDNIKSETQETGHKCLIHMDLGGPKLRTGEIIPGNAVIKVRPQRDEFGTVTQPATVWLVGEKEQAPEINRERNLIPVPDHWLGKLNQGDMIVFKDVRGSKRRMQIIEAWEDHCVGALYKTAYFIPGLELQIEGRELDAPAVVGALPKKENFLLLQVGDQLIVKKNQTPGIPAAIDDLGFVVQPATIGCTLPEVLGDVRMGESIWFDDGKIGGVIEAILPEAVSVRINYARQGGVKLRKEKGINLPDTNLSLSALTEEDLEDLKFAVQYADTIGLSFANGPEDVRKLITEIRKLTTELPGIVLKIETARGFDHLPDMLLAALEIPKCGVMIARGDLAIECGFGRLAELQEEILWICEAAHVPVIWATQVLEELAKSGVHTRSEVTDAAMGQRAECIMLNKGEHIVTATKALDDILCRMQDHQTKKRATHRKLRLAEGFFERLDKVIGSPANS